MISREGVVEIIIKCSSGKYKFPSLFSVRAILLTPESGFIIADYLVEMIILFDGDRRGRIVKVEYRHVRMWVNDTGRIIGDILGNQMSHLQGFFPFR